MTTSTSNNLSSVTVQPQLQPLQLLQQSPHFVNATVALIEAVAARARTREEAQKLLYPLSQSMILENKHPLGLNLSELHSQRTNLKNKHKAEQAQHDFFHAFQQRIAELDIDRSTPLYGSYARAAQQLIEESALLSSHVDAIKKESILQDFDNRVFKDIVEVLASKPLAEITISAFKQKTSELGRLFPRFNKDRNLVEIETKLRQAIKAHHTKEEFKKVREKFTNLKPDEFKAAAQKIEAEYKAVKTKIEARLKELRGEKYGDENSLLHKAHVVLEKANKDKEKAKAEFDVAIGKVAGDVKGVYGDDLVEFYQNFLANENKDGAIIEARLKELRGEKYGDENSLLHKAHVALHKATKEKEKAKAEFFIAISTVAQDVNEDYGDDPVARIQHFFANENNDGAYNIGYITGKLAEYKAKLKAFNEAQENSDKLNEEFKKVELFQHFFANENNDGAYNNGYITGKLAEYKAKLKAFNEAQENRDELNEEFKKIARYQPGTENLNGGILHYINKTLEAGPEVEARKQMDKMANFYAELRRTVGDVNKEAFSRNLRRIIG